MTEPTPTMHILGHDIPITPDLERLASLGMDFPSGIGLRALASVLSEHGRLPGEYAVRTALARAVCLLAEDERDRMMRDAIAAGASARADSTPAVVRDLAAMWEALREINCIHLVRLPRVELYSGGSGRLVDNTGAKMAEWDRLPDAAPAIRGAIAEGGGR